MVCFGKDDNMDEVGTKPEKNFLFYLTAFLSEVIQFCEMILRDMYA